MDTREKVLATVAKLWLHYNDDIRGNRLHEAERFKNQAERMMLLHGLAMEDVFPKKKRVMLQFETQAVRRVKTVMGIMEIAESRNFIVVHDMSLLRGQHYTLAVEFSGKTANVDFILNHFQTKKLI